MAYYCSHTCAMFDRDGRLAGVYRCSGKHTTDEYGLWHLAPEGVPWLDGSDDDRASHEARPFA